MDDEVYVELFNELLREYNSGAPQVDSVRFARIREVLGCDEFTALFILGTQVPPELSLVTNRKLPVSVLQNSYLVRNVACDFATVADLAQHYMTTPERVRVIFMATSGESHKTWLEQVLGRLERTMIAMHVRDVVGVVRDKGMDVNEARAVEVRTSGVSPKASTWICVGQRVLARRHPSDEPMEGEVISIAPVDGVAVVKLTDAELYPGVSQGMFRVGLPEPIDEMAPFVKHEPARSGARARSRRSAWGHSKHSEAETRRDRQVLSSISEKYYPGAPVPPLDYGRLFSVRLYVECDSEVAFFVLGTQVQDRDALVVNRTKPMSEQVDAFALEELPQDVLTIQRLSTYFMREPEEIRAALRACSFDLTSDAGRALVDDLRSTRERMRANGVVGVMRGDGMGPNEAASVGLADEAFVAGHDDTTIFDGTTTLTLRQRACVARGEAAGLVGTIVSLAPIDGMVGIMPDGEDTPAVVVPMLDVEVLG